MKDPFDLSVELKPRKRVRKLRESDIQKACVAYARSKKFWARKFSSPSQRSVPDFLFGKKYPRIKVKWAEEFKAPKETSTEAQLEEQDAMIAAGWTVVRDTGKNGQEDIDAFKRRIDEFETLNGEFK